MIIEYEDMLIAIIDERIQNASDDELFAGGYLRGHISLSTAACEEEGINDVALLKLRIQASLDEAKAELSPADRIIVNDLWSELQALV
ncbi:MULTISPECIES: YfcL family protein [Vibrio]|uniref:YfcL family protein n=1 Tax=Vibrio TaxID=662 RepID=UPI003D0B132C